MTSYKAVPGKLRATTTQLQEAANEWDQAYKVLEATKMGPMTLGIIGKMAGAPDRYNAALESVLDGLKKIKKAIEGAGAELDAVARTYEQKDCEYYEKFGYLRP